MNLTNFFQITISFGIFYHDCLINIFRLTANALDVLSEGIESEWQNYLFVDTNILNELANYLIKMQDRVTGVFHDVSNEGYLMYKTRAGKIKKLIAGFIMRKNKNAAND